MQQTQAVRDLKRSVQIINSELELEAFILTLPNTQRKKTTLRVFYLLVHLLHHAPDEAKELLSANDLPPVDSWKTLRLQKDLLDVLAPEVLQKTTFSNITWVNVMRMVYKQFFAIELPFGLDARGFFYKFNAMPQLHL